MHRNSLICDTAKSISTTAIFIDPGNKIACWRQHIIGGLQAPSKAVSPIATMQRSVMAYKAPMDDAGEVCRDGPRVAEDGLERL